MILEPGMILRSKSGPKQCILIISKPIDVSYMEGAYLEAMEVVHFVELATGNKLFFSPHSIEQNYDKI
jgi:hypothetical protein